MIVVEGVPHKLESPEAYEDRDWNTGTRMNFRVKHPVLGEVKYEQLFEAKNNVIEAVQEAAKTGKVVKLVCRVEAMKGGKGPTGAWSKLIVREVIA